MKKKVLIISSPEVRKRVKAVFEELNQEKDKLRKKIKADLVKRGLISN